MNKTVIKRVERHGSHNYIYNNYFNKTKCSLCISLDFITLNNVHPDNEIMLYEILNSNKFTVVKDVKLDKGNYKMKRVYKNCYDNTVVDIYHHQKYEAKGDRSLSIRIHHPSQEIVSFLDSIFKFHGINPKVSQIEMTFDFYVGDTTDFRNLLKSHLFLKNQGSYSFTYKGETFYTNNLRKSAKGMRLYIKQNEIGQKIVRLELVLRRPLIHRLGLQFPLNDIDSLTLSKFFYFAHLKEDDFKKYVFKRNKRSMEQLGEIDPFEVGIIEDHVESWLRCSESLMEKVEVIRDGIKIKNCSRFIEPLNNFNKKFFNIVSSQKFITPRRKKGNQILNRKYVGVTVPKTPLLLPAERPYDQFTEDKIKKGYKGRFISLSLK